MQNSSPLSIGRAAAAEKRRYADLKPEFGNLTRVPNEQNNLTAHPACGARIGTVTAYEAFVAASR